MIVAVTAAAMKADRENVWWQGVTIIYPKPVEPNPLINPIGRYSTIILKPLPPERSR